MIICVLWQINNNNNPSSFVLLHGDLAQRLTVVMLDPLNSCCSSGFEVVGTHCCENSDGLE